MRAGLQVTWQVTQKRPWGCLHFEDVRAHELLIHAPPVAISTHSRCCVDSLPQSFRINHSVSGDLLRWKIATHSGCAGVARSSSLTVAQRPSGAWPPKAHAGIHAPEGGHHPIEGCRCCWSAPRHGHVWPAMHPDHHTAGPTTKRTASVRLSGRSHPPGVRPR